MIHLIDPILLRPHLQIAKVCWLVVFPQPILRKICPSQNVFIFPNFRGENTTMFETTTGCLILFLLILFHCRFIGSSISFSLCKARDVSAVQTYHRRLCCQPTLESGGTCVEPTTTEPLPEVIQSIGLFLVLEVFQQCSSSPGAAEWNTPWNIQGNCNSQLHDCLIFFVNSTQSLGARQNLRLLPQCGHFLHLPTKKISKEYE